MSRNQSLWVKWSKDGKHLRIGRGWQYVFTIRATEALALANLIVDQYEERRRQ